MRESALRYQRSHKRWTMLIQTLFDFLDRHTLHRIQILVTLQLEGRQLVTGLHRHLAQLDEAAIVVIILVISQVCAIKGQAGNAGNGQGFEKEPGCTTVKGSHDRVGDSPGAITGGLELSDSASNEVSNKCFAMGGQVFVDVVSNIGGGEIWHIWVV